MYKHIKDIKIMQLEPDRQSRKF